MPKNKKPLLRYRVIDNCLRNTAKRYGFKELLDEINKDLVYRGLEPVGKTTFYQDIKDLKVEFQAPIEDYREGGRAYYRYTDADYSFANQPLNQEEIEHLKDAVMILNRFSGLPGFEWVEEAAGKLSLGVYESPENSMIISFEHNEFLKGKEFIGVLFKAIRDQKVVDVGYQTFREDEIKHHIIHPYFLKEFDSRWYILGFTPKYEDHPLTLSVDRIDSIEIKEDEQYQPNTKFDFDEYFEDLIGVWRDKTKEPVKVVLKFTSKMSRYIDTKPLHGSQKVVRRGEDGSLIISLEVIHNFELENLIFNYNVNVEVLEPANLRERISEMAIKIKKQYDS
ncbi:MAG: WYL domain-containing protein [Cyclobacteriaceae bacterium]